MTTATDFITIDVPTIDITVMNLDGLGTRPHASAAYHDGRPTYRMDASVNCARAMIEVFADGTGLIAAAWHYQPDVTIDERGWLRYGLTEVIGDPDGLIAQYDESARTRGIYRP